MLHTYENAIKIREAYEHLIGDYHDKESNITDICIVPVNLKQLAHFLEYYKVKNAEESLMLSGYDEKRVRIVVIFEQTLILPGHMLDLDEYLTKKGIEKTYDMVTRTFVTPN
ncbi:MAG: hypothetical protein QM737_16925 [Ferruginibacter sp.]